MFVNQEIPDDDDEDYVRFDDGYVLCSFTVTSSWDAMP